MTGTNHSRILRIALDRPPLLIEGQMHVKLGRSPIAVVVEIHGPAIISWEAFATCPGGFFLSLCLYYRMGSNE